MEIVSASKLWRWMQCVWTHQTPIDTVAWDVCGLGCHGAWPLCDARLSCVTAPGVHGRAHDGRRDDVPAGARLLGELPGAHLLPALHPVHLRLERRRCVFQLLTAADGHRFLQLAASFIQSASHVHCQLRVVLQATKPRNALCRLLFQCVRVAVPEATRAEGEDGVASIAERQRRAEESSLIGVACRVD